MDLKVIARFSFAVLHSFNISLVSCVVIAVVIYTEIKFNMGVPSDCWHVLKITQSYETYM